MIDLLLWLATYLLHSTVFLIVVYVITRFMGLNQLRLQNALWKTAVFAGIITASLQTSGIVTSLSDSLTIPFLIEETYSNSQEISTNSYTAVQFSNSLNYGTQISFQQSNHIIREIPATAVAPASFLYWFLAIWLLGTIYGISRLTIYQVQLSRLSRKPVHKLSVQSAFQNILNSAGVSRDIHLTQSAKISSPIVLSASEICLPNRLIDEMSPHQQRSVLAHEVSHIIRRDSAWFLALAFIESVFFFQPLNRIARRHIRTLTEYSCDDWAIDRTGRSLDLARCLANVASWAKHPVASHVPAMASGGLRKRVSRILDSNISRSNLPVFVSLAIVTGLITLLCFTTPTFTIDRESQSVTYQIHAFSSKSQITYARGLILQTQSEERVVIYVPERVKEEATPGPQIIWH